MELKIHAQIVVLRRGRNSQRPHSASSDRTLLVSLSQGIPSGKRLAPFSRTRVQTPDSQY